MGWIDTHQGIEGNWEYSSLDENVCTEHHQ